MAAVIGPARVRRLAQESGYSEDIVEKVLYLDAILSQLVRHPALQGAWVLKGGTGLNLFFLDVPRLSVDIDINYIGQAARDDMEAARPGFEAALVACCEREGCAVRRLPADHAGGKLLLRYTGSRGPGSLEVDVNFLFRIPLLGVEQRAPRFPADATPDPVPLLTFEELAAAKFTALLARRAARDAFDAVQVLDSVPDLLDRPGFRLAFMIFAAGNRKDVRRLDPRQIIVRLRDIRTSLFPLLRVGSRPAGEGAETLTERMNAICVTAGERLVRWTGAEREFLDRLNDHGEVVAELLTDDPDRRALVERQPLLQWKAQNVRQFKRQRP